nr:FeoB-associated Cys-rich membrane protein [uncultured Blautia sp.]
MTTIFGTGIVIAGLVLIAGLAARSLWKEHKKGGHCTGNCGSCGSCHCK